MTEPGRPDATGSGEPPAGGAPPACGGPADAAARFSGRVEAYARHRPGYPAEVLEVLREEIGVEPGWVVADIGSGTGLSSELLLEGGHRVIGVEPNAEMRAEAEARLGGHPRFESVAGRAEATTLPDRSVDLVAAAQAFHWFEPLAARREFARILRGEWAVLLYNTRRIGGSPFMEGYEELLMRRGTDYEKVRHDRRTEATIDRFYPGPHDRRLLENRQVLDLEGLVGRTLSCSYVPAAGEAGHVALLAELEELFERHAADGAVRMEYDTEVHFGRLR